MILKKTEKIAFIGGDLRQIRAINKIAKCGISVKTFGFNEEATKKLDASVEIAKTAEEIKNYCNVNVLPLPYSTDGERINAPFSDNVMLINNIIKILPPKSLLLAGRCDEKLKTLSEICDLMLIDYFSREELMVLNAIPTAEGALQIAMEETPHTLHGAKCLVAGGGRIAKILAKMLDGIGAEVFVTARKRGDLALAEAFGYRNVPIWELDRHIDKFEVVFNTIPSMILDFHQLSKMRKSCLIIDLASKPGGVDFDAAQALGIKVIWALSLPGKVAPSTAGDIIASTILNILEEMEV